MMQMVLFRIMVALSEGPGDANEVLERLRRGGGFGVPSVPAFYRHLRKGLEHGWIAVDGIDADTRGRPAQRYALSPAGERAVEEYARELRGLTRRVLDEPAGS